MRHNLYVLVKVYLYPEPHCLVFYMTILPGVKTRSRTASKPLAEVLELPSAKRSKREYVSTATPSPPHKQTAPVPVPPAATEAYQQWLEDVKNVDISLSISGSTDPADSTCPDQPFEFSVSMPVMLTRLLQSKLGIDSDRLTTTLRNGATNDLAIAVSVKGREEPILEAIAGGLTPRKAFIRSSPHISRVASRLQDCLRQIFGIRDFVVKID